ncbi:MAG: hypothetical protein ABJA67_13675 [Chthonomonadales bacterium]
MGFQTKSRNLIAKKTTIRTSVAVCSTFEDAQGAVTLLKKAGLSTKKLSVVGLERRLPGPIIACCKACDEKKSQALHGSPWDGVWSEMVGGEHMHISGIGFVVMAGPLISEVMKSLKVSYETGDLTAIGAALVRQGVDSLDAVRTYERELRSGKLLLIIRGAPLEIAGAHFLLGGTPDGRATRN